LIQGIATIWGHWDDKTRTWSNEKRLNTIGRMSGLVEFDNNKALSAAGLPALQPGQAQAMQRLWFQDASIDQWENFELVDGLKQLSDPNYLKVRQDLFKSVDFDNDDMLDMDEARFFFREVRKLDRTLMPEFLPNYELPYVDTHIYAAQTMSTPYDKVRFDDYLKVEKIMMAWYKAGKLQATGTINPYKQDDKSTITDVALGTYFRSSCDM